MSTKAGQLQDEAWNNLIKAQVAATQSISAHESVRQAMTERLNWLEKLESTLFPPQAFVSPALVAKKTHCSICMKPYEECRHIKGKAYNGEFCSEVIEAAQLREISIVPDPADKRARVTAIGDGDVRRDAMTLRPISDEQ